jgi:hypothetical protein
MVGTGDRWTYTVYIFSAHGHSLLSVGLLFEKLSLSGLAVLYFHLFYLLDIYVSANGHFTILYYHLHNYDYTSYVSQSGK